jgi:hypothetical protein
MKQQIAKRPRFMAEQGKSQRVRMNAFQIRQMNHVYTLRCHLTHMAASVAAQGLGTARSLVKRPRAHAQ